MPNSTKKRKSDTASPNPSPTKGKQKSDCNTPNNNNNNANNKPRKRKRRRLEPSSDETELESELEECNLEDALALERKLRNVAKTNSLNDEEMKKLLQKFVKNDHVLALVTLKAEDELAREQRAVEQPAILVTHTPSIPKLTRAKARELNKTPAITLPALNDAPQPEIVALINQELQSDDEDEEYTFKEEDFVSDDDHNVSNSDFDSNPCTPQTPHTQTEYEDSPVKLTSDGCFKIPLDKQSTTQENLRIAARTRSKLCLEQTTIEDIQSEFVPPDVDLNETHDTDLAANDKDWMEFLTYISNPLNNSLLGDDDDPVNDPEYVAADKEPVDAEELRDVNISKKELQALFAELFEGLVNESIPLESVDLETPEKFLQNNSSLQTSPAANKLTPTAAVNAPPMPTNNARLVNVTRQIDFGVTSCDTDTTMTNNTSMNVSQQTYNFQTDIINTTAPTLFEPPGRDYVSQNAVIPVASNTDTFSSNVTIPAAISAPDLIAIPVPGQPNHFNLARVVSPNKRPSNDANYDDDNDNVNAKDASTMNPHDYVSRYTLPYDNNYTWRYISIQRHVHSEYMDKFENLRHITDNNPNETLTEEQSMQGVGFTRYQHDLLQQQLRIHIQMLTQTYVQIYCHPEYWKSAPEIRSLLDELHEKSKTHATFNAWNLMDAIELVEKWEEDLASDTPENKAFMDFIHKEISFCCHNTRQVPRFPPRIMELILNSKVFMYPKYLPRIPFTPKHFSYHIFAPSEFYLIALGLEKHMKRIKKLKLKSTASPYVIACKHMAKDTIFGKSMRRVYDQMNKLIKADYYNPVKYYFDHNRAPPIEQHLITFENNTVLPPIQRLNELPLAWQNYIQEKNKSATELKQQNAPPADLTPAPATPPRPFALNYLDIVREAVGENIQLPDSITEAATPAASATDTTNTAAKKHKRTDKRRPKLPTSVTINVNYIFGATPNQTDISSLINSTSNTQPNITTISVSPQRGLTRSYYQSTAFTATSTPTTVTPATAALGSNIVAYNYDFNRQHLEPVVAEITEITDSAGEVPQEHDIRSQTVAEQITPKTSFAKATCRPLRRIRQHWRHSYNHNKRFGTSRQRHRAALLYRQKNSLKKHFLQLLAGYHRSLQQQELPFHNSPLLLLCFRKFRALDLYTNLLDNLKMICRNAVEKTSAASAQTACSSATKRSRLDDDGPNTTRSGKKINRQEENLRTMLLPDTPEDANRKDAIYAFNFYEKVEEIFKADNRLEEFEKFNNILKSFDPKCDRAATLYNKLELLFMPHYPLLAQVFLTFLLPSEAAEIGKFFEHFMITNSTTFYNKLNIYFSNQPAQMRKILSCLNELAEEENVTMKKLEERILPLLKGNQFLIDWFMQQFPEAPVPERILPAPENVNLKEVQGKQGGESIETVRDILNSPVSDQPPACQLRYINGRIFYGSKFTLPAKLSFMASKSAAIKDEQISTLAIDTNKSGCLHGIRHDGEARLAAAAAAAASTSATTAPIQISSDDDGNAKSEDDELSKALIIDTTCTGGEDDSCSSIEACDDATLRAHAMRLNPNYYNSTCFSSVTATSTPNIGNTHQAHHPNARKQSLNFGDDVKLSPRKTNIGSPMEAPQNSLTGSNSANAREKRKSPTKKIKSPNTSSNVNKLQQAAQNTRAQNQQQPMVVIPRGEHGAGAIAFAQKLKTLVDSNDEQTQSMPTTIVAPQTSNVGAQVPIVARVKQRPFVDLTTMRSSDDSLSQHNLVPKLEKSDDLEFLPEHTPPRGDEQNDFPRLQLEPDSSNEGNTAVATTASTTKTKQQHSSTQQLDSDEDYKLDIVATLTTGSDVSKTNTATATNSMPKRTSAAFTREEDKILLLEMQAGSRDREDLIQRISKKLPQRTRAEIIGRHQFLIDFLSRMQGN